MGGEEKQQTAKRKYWQHGDRSSKIYDSCLFISRLWPSLARLYIVLCSSDAVSSFFLSILFELALSLAHTQSTHGARVTRQ